MPAMRNSRSLWGAVVVSALAFGMGACGPSPDSTTPTGVATGTSTAEKEQPVADGKVPGVQPAAEPANLIGVLRFKSPSETIKAIVQGTGLPQDLVSQGTQAILEEM